MEPYNPTLNESVELANILSKEIQSALKEFAEFVNKPHTPEEWQSWFVGHRMERDKIIHESNIRKNQTNPTTC